MARVDSMLAYQLRARFYGDGVNKGQCQRLPEHPEPEWDEWLLDFGEADCRWCLSAIPRSGGAPYALSLEDNRFVAAQPDGTLEPHFFVGRDLCHPGINARPQFLWRAPRNGRFLIEGTFALRNAYNEGGAKVTVYAGDSVAVEAQILYGQAARLKICFDAVTDTLVTVRIDFVTHLYAHDILFSLMASEAAPDLAERVQFTTDATEAWVMMAHRNSIADLQHGLNPKFSRAAALGVCPVVNKFTTPPAELWAEAERLIKARPKPGQPGFFHVSRARQVGDVG